MNGAIGIKLDADLRVRRSGELLTGYVDWQEFGKILGGRRLCSLSLDRLKSRVV